MTITVKDIQVQNVRADSNPNNDNKVRKSWVLQTPELVQEKIKQKYKSQEARFAFYDAVDSAVSDKWVQIMRNHYKDSIANGAKLVLTKAGAERLEDDYCVDPDTQLIDAAAIIVAEVIEDLAA